MTRRDVSIKQLKRSTESVASLQAVIDASAEYSRLTSGAEPEPDSAAGVFDALPPGKSMDDKFVFAVCVEGECVGCVDLVRDYPRRGTAMLGLLLIAEPHQRSGVGKSAYTLVEDFVRTWPQTERVRIGVIETNSKVLPFWHRMGFRHTGEDKPYSDRSITSRVIVLERALQDAADLSLAAIGQQERSFFSV